MKKANSAIHTLIVFCFSIIISYLMILAGFSTSKMDCEEHTYLVGDSMAGNVLCFLLFIVLFSGIIIITRAFLSGQQKRVLSESKSTNRIHSACNVLLCAIGIFAALFVVATQRSARADQGSVQDIVNQWVSMDFSCFDKGAYLDRYPNQAGIIIICYFLSFVFGTRNYLAFQLANAIALCLIYRESGDIAEKKTGRALYRLVIYGFGLLFLPGIMYTGFVYGNVIGLALSLVSFKHALLFNEKPGIKNGCITVLSILLAVIIKQNYLIFGIALALFILAGLIKKFQGKLLALLTAVLLVLPAAGMITNEIVFSITGSRLSKGLSRWSWVTMGVMENESLYDGWWNNYNYDSYMEADCDAGRQAARNKEDLKERLRLFKNDPRYAVRFFAGKNASQWNNPEFQCVWNNQIMPENTIIRQPPWANGLINEDDTGPIPLFLNYFHFILLAGVLLHVFQGGVKNNLHELFFILTFMGGFVFHTIWEAKAQYTISYFWLLLPLSAEGYVETTDRISFLLKNKKIRLPGKASRRLIASLSVAVTALVLLSVYPSFFRDVFLRDEDTTAFSEHVANNKVYILPAGDYYIHPKQNSALCLTREPAGKAESASLVFRQDDDQETETVYLSSSAFGEYQIISFGDGGYVLDVPGNNSEAGIEVWTYSKNASAAQRWLFRHKDVNEYAIMHDGLALTYSLEEEKTYLDYYSGTEQQKWIIEKVGSDNKQ